NFLSGLALGEAAGAAGAGGAVEAGATPVSGGEDLPGAGDVWPGHGNLCSEGFLSPVAGLVPQGSGSGITKQGAGDLWAACATEGTPPTAAARTPANNNPG